MHHNLLLISIPHPAPRLLAPLLISYEKSTKETEFTNNSYPCAVCLTAYKGSKCLQLACSHIFCRTCLEDFWTLCITEGDVGRVGCPDPECVKAGREANEEEVARVVTDQDLQRWRWLREKRALEKGMWWRFILSLSVRLIRHRSLSRSLPNALLPDTCVKKSHRRRRRITLGPIERMPCLLIFLLRLL